MKNIHIQYYTSPVGELIIGSYKENLCLCDWRYRKMRNEIDNRIQEGINAVFVEKESSIISITIQQLEEYFTGKRKDFSVPMQFTGTDFQKNVWNELLNIPFGKTETYLSLSRKIGKEKAIRAVAAANGANAISILVPCHRIVGSNGELVGYAGGLQAKKSLLKMESSIEQLELF